mgnify:CR=1 FL=1
MRFAGGDACEAPLQRQALLRFECGEEDALLGVLEPSTCSYEARFRSPSGCSMDELRRKHLELDAAAKAAGLPYAPSEALTGLLGL